MIVGPFLAAAVAMERNCETVRLVSMTFLDDTQPCPDSVGRGLPKGLFAPAEKPKMF